MKAVRILLEEDLLARLDQDKAVRYQGRSAVLRHIIKDYSNFLIFLTGWIFGGSRWITPASYDAPV